MTTLTLFWNASDQLRKREAAATGAISPQERKLQVDFAALTPAQREAMLADPDLLVGNLTKSWSAQRRLTGLPDTPTATSYPYEPVTFDQEPSIDQLLAVVGPNLTLMAQQAARKAEHDRAEGILWRQRNELEALCKSDIDALEQAGDLQGLRAYRRHFEMFDRASGVQCVQFRNVEARREAAVRDLHRKHTDAEKARWIAAHGSAHLQRAFAASYNCQRLYVVERAALEAPDWIVDINATGQEKDRACPSMAALDIEEAASLLAQTIGTKAVFTVWLTDLPTHQAGERHDEEHIDLALFEPCEAVKMTGYLSKYDLYRIVESV